MCEDWVSYGIWSPATACSWNRGALSQHLQKEPRPLTSGTWACSLQSCYGWISVAPAPSGMIFRSGSSRTLTHSLPLRNSFIVSTPLFSVKKKKKPTSAMPILWLERLCPREVKWFIWSKFLVLFFLYVIYFKIVLIFYDTVLWVWEFPASLHFLSPSHSLLQAFPPILLQ